MAIRSKTKEEQQQTGLAVTDRASAEAALSAGGYEKSDPVLAAEQRLAEYEQTKPGAYSSAYQDKIDGLLDRILNREGFSYDFNADPLYQTYKDQYLHNGRLALQDTMAGAAAATGGYTSSYAAAAGSGAYQSYLNQLNGRLPELYRAALERYQANGSTLQEQLTGLTAQEKSAQAAYQDQVADYYKGLSAYSDAAENAYDADYAEYESWRQAVEDQRDYYARQEQQSLKNTQSEKEYALALARYQEKIREWEAEQRAGQAQFDAELAYKKEQTAKKESGTKSAGAASAGNKASGKSGTRKSKTGGSSDQNRAGGGAGRQKESYDQALANSRRKI